MREKEKCIVCNKEPDYVFADEYPLCRACREKAWNGWSIDELRAILGTWYQIFYAIGFCDGALHPNQRIEKMWTNPGDGFYVFHKERDYDGWVSYVQYAQSIQEVNDILKDTVEGINEEIDRGLSIHLPEIKIYVIKNGKIIKRDKVPLRVFFVYKYQKGGDIE